MIITNDNIIIIMIKRDMTMPKQLGDNIIIMIKRDMTMPKQLGDNIIIMIKRDMTMPKQLGIGSPRIQAVYFW